MPVWGIKRIRLRRASWNPFRCPKWELRNNNWSITLDRPYVIKGQKPNAPLGRYVCLDWTGETCVIKIKEGYVWDVSGEGFAFFLTGKRVARAAMLHDALYDAIACKAINRGALNAVDLLFRDHMIEAGCSVQVAKGIYGLVRFARWLCPQRFATKCNRAWKINRCN